MDKIFREVIIMSKMSKLPHRSELPVDKTWDLSAIYSTEKEWKDDIKSFYGLLEEIGAYKGRLSCPDNLVECLTKIDLATIKARAIKAYAWLMSDTDKSNSKYKENVALATSLIDKGDKAIAYVKPELLNLKEEVINEIYKTTPALKKYEFYFRKLAKLKKHILPDEQEKIFTISGPLRRAPYDIYTTFVNADIKLPEIIDENGEHVTLSPARARKFIQSSNRDVRRNTYEKMTATYHSYRNTFASIYNASIKASELNSQIHHYDSIIESALDENNIPISLYELTVNAIHDYIPLLQRYMRLKKQMLKYDKFYYYDTKAPLTSSFENELTFEEGCRIIKEALAPLGDDYLKKLDKAFNERWIDYMENVGKKSGAYNLNVYAAHPYLLMSWQNSYDSLSTLAHELGHAMHCLYSNENQEFVNSTYAVFCAEIASTVNENLLREYNYKNSDEKGKLYYDHVLLDGIYVTVYNQTMFAEFEKNAHELVEKGGYLTADLLESMWVKLLQRYYGETVELHELAGAGWSRIPHFYRPFYVYQYATGFVSAYSISQNILYGDGETVKKYIDFLSSGGSDYPINILNKTGIDITKYETFSFMFKKFKETLIRLENAYSL